MPRPHAAAVLEDAYNGRKGRVLRSRGWTTRVVPLTGYGSVTQLRVFGRVIMTRGRPEDEPEEPTYAARLRAVELETRGWRAFFATPAVDEPVTVRIDRRADHRRAGAGRRPHGDARHHLRHRRHRAVDVVAPADDRGVEHVHALRGRPPGRAGDGDDVPRAARRAAGRPHHLPLNGGLEHGAAAHPLPAPQRFSRWSDAAHRLGADQLRVVPLRPGAQARPAAPARPRAATRHVA